MTNNTVSILTKRSSLLILVLPLTLSIAAQALPEDANQPIVGSYGSSQLLLDEGKQILYAGPDGPAEISQGTLNVSGEAITIESTDGLVKKITVTGSPARFQQQPSSDQALAIAEGGTIILDYDTQHLSVDDNARFSQDKNLWTACHIDYYMESKSVTTPNCENQASLFLPPRQD